MNDLKGFKVAVIVTDGFEEAELTEPAVALRTAGATVEILSPKEGNIQGYRHHEKSVTVTVDHLLSEVVPESYDGLLLPGGALNADAIRMNPEAQEFVKNFDEARKPIASICHAPWLLVSSGLVKGRKLTSYSSIQDDIRNAGGHWVDQEVVHEKNWITSRRPQDIPAFNREVLRAFAEAKKSSGVAV